MGDRSGLVALGVPRFDVDGRRRYARAAFAPYHRHVEPLVVLLGAFALLSLVGWLRPAWALAPAVRGRAALGVMLIFTGASHFVLADEMAAMVPRHGSS